jgi:copper homeostasis protein
VPLTPILIEACVDSVESAIAAEEGGAGRVELCANLIEGGTTPSDGALALCRERLGIPIRVLVRPRGGDFLYSDIDFEIMRKDVLRTKELGADGVVLGLLQADGSIDCERTERLIDAARPMGVTFHRAFDVCHDPEEALEQLVTLGVDRVLTSGQAAGAPDGISTIARLVQLAAERIGILPGGGIDETNVMDVVRGTGVREVHLRATVEVESGMMFRAPQVQIGNPPPTDDYVREVTDAGVIGRIRKMLGTEEAGQ